MYENTEGQDPDVQKGFMEDGIKDDYSNCAFLSQPFNDLETSIPRQNLLFFSFLSFQNERMHAKHLKWFLVHRT